MRPAATLRAMPASATCPVHAAADFSAAPRKPIRMPMTMRTPTRRMTSATTASTPVAIRRKSRIGWPDPAKAALCEARPSPRSDHDDLGANPHALVEIGHVLVAHADAAGGNRSADRPGLVRAVDAVERGAKIHRARAKRIVRTARHMARQVGAALEHFGRRHPVRPLRLPRDALDARPGEPGTADADAIADRLAVLLHQIEKAVWRIDDDRAGGMRALVRDDLLLIARVHLARGVGRLCALRSAIERSLRRKAG